MEIFKSKDGKTITYDNNRASVVDVKELLLQKKDIEGRISESALPDDKELLEWARNNWSIVDYSMEIKELDKINEVLDSVRDILIESK